MEDSYVARLGERTALLEANARLTDGQLKQLQAQINTRKNEHKELKKQFDDFMKTYGDDKDGKDKPK